MHSVQCARAGMRSATLKSTLTSTAPVRLHRHALFFLSLSHITSDFPVPRMAMLAQLINERDRTVRVVNWIEELQRIARESCVPNLERGT